MKYSYETFRDANGIQRAKITRLEDNVTIPFNGDPSLGDIAMDTAFRYASVPANWAGAAWVGRKEGLDDLGNTYYN
jgi:hypothetical protein